ncbi:MAG: hypothetical protein JOY96_01110 [Verrucomicrobia bacterium]|nr:hypothetical protein [Verrucomicrobiota bacterium]
MAVVTGLMVMQSTALCQASAIARGDPVSRGSTPELVRLENRVRADRLHAPEIVAAALRTDSRRPIICVSEIMRAAIRGLGKSVSKIEIARLVAAAVEARPDAALEIVRVAVEETRPQLHSDILAAAVGAVPDPYVLVSTLHVREPSCFDSASAEELSLDGKNIVSDGKSFGGGKQPVGEEVLGYEPSNSPDSTTLAEAIVSSAIGAGSTAGVDSLYSSINSVLTGPWLFPDTDEIPLPTPTPSPVSPGRLS